MTATSRRCAASAQGGRLNCRLQSKNHHPGAPVPPLSVMFKTVSTECNLDCSYCYYRESLDGARVRRRTGEDLLSRFIPEYMAYVADSGAASLAWQGGEPTLAGLPFFERVVELEARNAAPGTTISNALQTNGLLIDDRWSSFLANFEFLVGVSLDGPQELHDTERRDRGGRGSFRRVMAGIDYLRAAAVDLNILCVVGPHNVTEARRLMRFYRREGFRYLQFIPAMDFQAIHPQEPARYAISPEEYGEFLVELFDEWHGAGKPDVSIRIFDNFVQSFLGVPNDLCVHAESCDAGIVLEYNGDAYPCDFYVHPRWKLGNVLEHPLAEIAASAARAAFVTQKHPLPTACQVCEYRQWCKGGCPRNRISREDGTASPDFFCASYRRFFNHATSRLTTLGDRIASRLHYLERLELIPATTARGRNSACLCGSGRKLKACCGDPALESSYLFRAGP